MFRSSHHKHFNTPSPHQALLDAICARDDALGIDAMFDEAPEDVANTLPAGARSLDSDTDDEPDDASGG